LLPQKLIEPFIEMTDTPGKMRLRYYSGRRTGTAVNVAEIAQTQY